MMHATPPGRRVLDPEKGEIHPERNYWSNVQSRWRVDPVVKLSYPGVTQGYTEFLAAVSGGAEVVAPESSVHAAIMDGARRRLAEIVAEGEPEPADSPVACPWCGSWATVWVRYALGEGGGALEQAAPATWTCDRRCCPPAVEAALDDFPEACRRCLGGEHARADESPCSGCSGFGRPRYLERFERSLVDARRTLAEHAVGAITGGRGYHPTGGDLELAAEIFRARGVQVVRHGGCPTGADKEAGDWLEARGWDVHPWPAPFTEFGRRGGPIRDNLMLTGVSVLVAFPGGRGTANCVKLARSRGIEVCRVGVAS